MIKCLETLSMPYEIYKQIDLVCNGQLSYSDLKLFLFLNDALCHLQACNKSSKVTFNRC